MALRVTSEDRAAIKDEFFAENEHDIRYYSMVIEKYRRSKVKLQEKDMVEMLNIDREDLEYMAGSILFTLATTQPEPLPLQTMAGMISAAISSDDTIDSRAKAMYVAMELLIESEDYVEAFETPNGYIMCRSLISDDEMILKNIALPLRRPTKQHKTLGKFDWELEETSALDKLNKVGMIILPIEDEKPEPATGEKYSKGYMKQKELCDKWEMRQDIKNQMIGEEIFFNWGADYRGRMYPVGYYYNPQGSELEKSMLGFYNGEKLDISGLVSYEKAFANAYGLDKQNDAEKIAWFVRNKNMLHLRRKNAKDKHMFDALLYGWDQHQQQKAVQVPIELDATQSQLQMCAVLLKNRDIAVTCNVVNSYDKDGNEIIQDAYQLSADNMSDQLA